MGYAWRGHRKIARGQACPAELTRSVSKDGLWGPSMWYLYIVRSVDFPKHDYVGATADLKQRMKDHNSGKSTHTAKFMPWKLIWYSAFPEKYKALEFERYLKSHSGRAFAKKRLTSLA